MTSQEREQLLRRFLEGQMTPQQEQDFYIQVAIDDELRLELKAHQTIQSALGKDAIVDPIEFAPLESRIALMLGSTAFMRPDADVSKSPGATAGVSLSTMMWSSSTIRWMMLALASGIVIAIIALLTPSPTIAPAAPNANQHEIPQTNQQRSAQPSTSVSVDKSKAQPFEAPSQQTKTKPAETEAIPSRPAESIEPSPTRYVAPEVHTLKSDSVEGRANIQLKNPLPNSK